MSFTDWKNAGQSRLINQMLFWSTRLVILLVFVGVVNFRAEASLIQTPHTAGRDAMLAGQTVAAPKDGASSLFINPAGVVSNARNKMELAAFPSNFTARYRDPGSGYDRKSSETPILADLWYGLGSYRDWSFGFGVYGSVGTAFNFEKDPKTGVNQDYLGKLSAFNVGFNAGTKITPNLTLGIQLTPKYGRNHLKTPSPVGAVDVEVEGFGVGGTVGLLYSPGASTQLGISYRSSSEISMDGDGTVGSNFQDVELDMVTPQSITGGISYEYAPNLILMAQAKWTDYSDFERGDLRFGEDTALNQPFLSSAKPRIRWGLGVEYAVADGDWFRVGYTYEPWMIRSRALKPILSDADDAMVMVGYEITYDNWRLGFVSGYTALDERRVSSGKNPNFPGVYEHENKVAAGVVVKFDL